MKKIFTFLVLALSPILAAIAQPSWTYSDTLKSAGKSGKVHVWIPETVTREGNVRGFVAAAHTVAEYGFVHDSALRAACERQQLAIVYFYPAPFTNFANGNNQLADLNTDTTYFLHALDKIGKATGYSEFINLPWITFGHSTSSAFVRSLSFWKPERSAGGIIYKGGDLRKPSWSNKNILSVPILGVNGEFEEYGPTPAGCNGPIMTANYLAIKDSILKVRRNGLGNTMLGLMLAGESHFGYAQKPGANLIAMFVEKAAQARIPQGVNAVAGPVVLNTIDPLRGFASDTNQVTQVPAIDTVPNIIAQGIPYYWYFDREMATAWRNYVDANVGKPHVTTRENGNCGNVEIFRNQAIYNDTIIVADSYFPTDARAQQVRNISGAAAGYPERKYGFKPSSFFESNLIWGIVELPATSTQKVSQKPIRYTLVPNTGGTDQTLDITAPTRVAAGQDFSIVATSSSGQPVEVEIFASTAITQTGNTYRVSARPTWKADTGVVRVRFTQKGGPNLRTKFRIRCECLTAS
jgi:hypothetical protein